MPAALIQLFVPALFARPSGPPAAVAPPEIRYTMLRGGRRTGSATAGDSPARGGSTPSSTATEARPGFHDPEVLDQQRCRWRVEVSGHDY